MLQVLDSVRAENARASRVRRALAKDGYRLVKCRRGYGGYGVIDCDRNFIVFGMSDDNRGYAATLDDVECWMAA